MNCEKNAVVCEGYHEKQIWKSGRERAEEGTRYNPFELEDSSLTEHLRTTDQAKPYTYFATAALPGT